MVREHVQSRVSVIIPNWNGLGHLDECFQALHAQTYRDFETILVDNASSDGSPEWVERNATATRVVRRADNGGFAAAVNEGILASAAEYVVLLNNDTSAEPDWLSELVNAMDRALDYDFAASLMLLYYEPGRVNAAGDIYALPLMAGRNRGLGKTVSEYVRPGRVLGACAGASIYRRAMFAEVGLFDEGFFLMSEDTDMNLRALIAGKRCCYVPTARVRHKVRASIDTEPSFDMKRLADRNEGMVIGKDLPALLFVLLPAMCLWRMLRKTILVSPKVWPKIPSLIAYTPTRVVAELEGFRKGLGKRKDVWARRGTTYWDIIRWMMVGWQPFRH